MQKSLPPPGLSPPSGGSMSWEPLRQRLVGTDQSADLTASLAAARELLGHLETVPASEFPLMLSALLPAVSTVLGRRNSHPDLTSLEHQVRHAVLEWISKLVHGATSNSQALALRPHAPHLCAVAMDVLTRDYEENAVTSSRILFDLYKTYRTLPTDYVQPYLKFVADIYRGLPQALARNFSADVLRVSPSVPLTPTVSKAQVKSGTAGTTADIQQAASTVDNALNTSGGATPASTAKASTVSYAPTDASIGSSSKKEQSQSTPVDPFRTIPPESSSMSVSSANSTGPTQLKKNQVQSSVSFRVLTECPLVVMLMFQLYPKFMKSNIPVLIQVMMESLTLRPPVLQKVFDAITSTRTTGDNNMKKIDSSFKRSYFSRVRELVAAQAKTLSFLTYLLRTFSSELKPYEDRLATNVVALMTTCPRESISTRKELLVATRHLLNSEFRAGFYRHVDAMLDERVLMGSGISSHNNRSDPTLIRPLAYTTLSDFCQHARTLLSMPQMSRVVVLFSRVLHDASLTLPLSTQYTAVRTLLSMIDLIFNNQDPNGQIGRDMLVRLFDTLVDKLKALTEYYPVVVRTAELQHRISGKGDEPINSMSVESDGNVSPKHLYVLHDHAVPTDSVRDVQSMIRAIIVGNKTLLNYLAGYRAQRIEFEKKANGSATTSTSSSNITTATPPPGSNDEVWTAMLKITNSEAAIIDRYILTSICAMSLLSNVGKESKSKNSLTTVAMSTGKMSASEKSLSEQHRDALTYFAAAFTVLDGYNLRRTIGRRLDVLFDAIVQDPMVMVIPRHLLGANKTTSFGFCSILLDFLVERMDILCYPRNTEIIFIDEQKQQHEISERRHVEEQIRLKSQLPAESPEVAKEQSITMLQLFERILKSLTVYPDNEAVVRRHLRTIVVVCLRSSMENIRHWPENSCMLLRYVFRSISAGKFEESYRELLPLIPSVLNGLYRVICSSEDYLLRSTAIELCLTIPARLSSLLPHMNLLLRIIIPALDSDAGDLVNLGLRTLEFWVDNLNPLFLYPEMSKQAELFALLMQALSRHLRPAPYPYGLLTLRLLGKLGGKNRQFLREPMVLSEADNSEDHPILLSCSWSGEGQATELDEMSASKTKEKYYLQLPIMECVKSIRILALISPGFLRDDDQPDRSGHKRAEELWECKIEKVNLSSYSKAVVEATRCQQAIACLGVIETVAHEFLQESADSSKVADELSKHVCLGLLFSCTIPSTKSAAFCLLKEVTLKIDCAFLADSLATFLSEPSEAAHTVGIDVIDHLFESLKDQKAYAPIFDALVCTLCEASCLNMWGRRYGIEIAIQKILNELGGEWSRKHEVKLVNAFLLPLKTVPREVSSAAVTSLRSFIQICSTLYGNKWKSREGDELIWDALMSFQTSGSKSSRSNASNHDDSQIGEKIDEPPNGDTLFFSRPSEEVIRIMLHELASHQHLVRFAARFVFTNFIVCPSSTTRDDFPDFTSRFGTLVRRVLFTRSLRLLPLAQQVGVVEGLTIIIHRCPDVMSLQDQHVLACLSEILKMASVADGEMSDEKLRGLVIDKNGYVSSEKKDSVAEQYPTHSSALFFRRQCIVTVSNTKVVVPGELPIGVQLRVSVIKLLHVIIRTYTDSFFEAEASAAIGNIRPHVISLLFRSLVSTPLEAVNAAQIALRDVLSLSSKADSDTEKGAKTKSRLPKELLQTCIRPVLLHLRDYTRLSVPLLRGLSRLLSLLSSWFNKTLGEKLLDHLQKWTDPSKIAGRNIWREGEEPLVAAAIVGIFSSLPNASVFVEHLVKTCIKLESTLPSYKVRFIESPFRKPLARYLDKYPQHTVAFFFPRLKTPMYSELFQHVVQNSNSNKLRQFLSNKQCSVMLLNVCFERPLAIIRSEKSGPGGSSLKASLSVHGVGKQPSVTTPKTGKVRPMNTEALELQLQGFRLVKTLLEYQPDYFRDHNDIVRAFRWLWRSKGRFLRLQHEDLVPPRFHYESGMLASFLMSYAKSFPNEDLDILFELFRVFLQPSTSDFAFVSRFLRDMVTNVLSLIQKKKVIQRFFASIAGDTNEEIKVLGVQFLVFPMLLADAKSIVGNSTRLETSNQELSTKTTSIDTPLLVSPQEPKLTNAGVIEKFVKEVIFLKEVPIPCGDRLKVELLRLMNLFVEYHSTIVEPFRKDMVKYSWALLKSDDTSCKCWAYVVVCQFISRFETPTKVVRQVYIALMKYHHQEGKELIRKALDLLVPALPRKLPAEELKLILEHTCHMILKEGSSVPHLAHVSHTIARNADIYRSVSARLSLHLVNSIIRFGLPPNGPQENRVLALDVVDLLLSWNRDLGSEQNMVISEHAETLCNFLIRLRLLVGESPTDGRGTGKGDTGSKDLEKRISALLRSVLSQWSPMIRIAPIEKAMVKESKISSPLLACLQILSLLIEFEYHDLIMLHSTLIQKIVLLSVKKARDQPDLQDELRCFVATIASLRSLSTCMLVGLEKVIDEASREQMATSIARGTETSRSRNRERATGGAEENMATLQYGFFAVELISVLCDRNLPSLNLISSSLLSFAKVLSKAHLVDAAAKQRQGSSNTTRTSAAGIRHHTPTIGILEEARVRDRVARSKLLLSRGRTLKDENLPSTSLRCLVAILATFETSDVIYTFTSNRKVLVQILSSIIEQSDDVKLLMIAVRTVGKWLLKDNAESPLTVKEKSSLLGRIAAFDFSNMPDDIAAQPLADLIGFLTLTFSTKSDLLKEEEFGRLTASCLLHSDTDVRQSLLTMFKNTVGDGTPVEQPAAAVSKLLWLLFHSDFEGLGARFWITVFVDILAAQLSCDNARSLQSLRIVAHGNASISCQLFISIFSFAWDAIPNDSFRVRLISSTESLLSKTFHSQLIKPNDSWDTRCSNAVRTFLNSILNLRPIPVLDTYLLVSLAENYNCWHEVLFLLEQQYLVLKNTDPRCSNVLSALRHCYRQLCEEDMWCTLAAESCTLAKSKRALAFDAYGMTQQSLNDYSELVDSLDSPACSLEPSHFEMDMWEERWVQMQRELCQFEVVSEFATASNSPRLQLDCAWRSQDWSKVRTLCTSSTLFAAVESGDPIIKMSETLLAVADGKLSDVENLHAQTAQLCLYKWQLLPRLSSGSLSHASLLHFFHRLVEIRESGQIMVETAKHLSLRTVPDLKNLLNAWRHRLPNDWESLSTWDEIFSWRAHMFSAITSNFNWCDSDTLATLHDRPWSSIRIAKTARKQDMRDVALRLLNKATEESAMNVSDAFLKLREQILAYFNPDSKLERHGGLNLINITNLSFFDSSQKSELFRLKAAFLQSLQGRSKANQAFCHSVQICPTHSRAWDSWGELCASLGAVTEKQATEQVGTNNNSSEGTKDIAKKVRQYLAQAMGCYFEAIQIDSHEWARIHIPKCLWMLSKDGSAPGVLCSTFENRGATLPAWVWLPWIPQLLTSLYRREGRAMKTVFAKLVKSYPQAIYYPLRAFYLERRDVDRVKTATTGMPAVPHQGSVAYAEELVSLLRRSHASLWSSLESVLEELIVKFRPAYEEELLATIIVLLERAEAHLGILGKKEDEESIVVSVWKTLGKIAVKFFRSTETNSNKQDARARKTAEFKDTYKAQFESDFQVSSTESASKSTDERPSIDLCEVIRKLRNWKTKLEHQVLATPTKVRLIEASSSLAMFGVGDAPDLWPGSCDPQVANHKNDERESNFDTDPGTTQSTTSSSAAAATKAAKAASNLTSEAAKKEGVGGAYGGGSTWIEIPGQYVPNTCSWTDLRPSPELHAKLIKFEPTVKVLRRSDSLVRRIGMMASDGKIYHFLLQFAVPYLTRTDERTSQIHYVLDKVLRKEIRSSRKHLSVQALPVIPVAQRLRLISEPQSRYSLEDAYSTFCLEKNICSSELSILFTDNVQKRLKKAMDAKAAEGPELKKLEESVRLEVFVEISSSTNTDSTLLLTYLTKTLPGPEPLYNFRRMFAQQWAANCLLQYAFSAGERTPSKIVFDCSSGRVFAPEFRIAYNNQGCIESQTTPYRLTPNLATLIGFPMLQSRFVTSMSMVSAAVHSCKHDIDPIFRLLMRDDLSAFYTKSLAKSDSKTHEMEKQLAGSVARNVATLQSRFASCSPLLQPKDDEAPDTRVRHLLLAAQNQKNLSKMSGGYQAWL